MIIKKFIAKTEADAVDAAKKELGSGIVVMNVKNAKRKGLFAFLKPQQIEVTVALEEEREIIKKEVPKPQLRSEAVLETKVVPNNQVIAESKEKESEIGEKLDSLQNLLEKQLMKPAYETKKEEEPFEESNPTVQFIKLLYNTMIENEVDEKYANQIVEDLDKGADFEQSVDSLLSNVYQKMILKFGTPVGITPAGKKPKVVFFLGPTGVGKTTTIAKLASKFHVTDNKKVALLTADTYRIAAAEQLRTYANIMEVPFRVIYSNEDLQTCLKEFMDYDYIMVDTAGHSHKNEEQRADMKQFVMGIPEDMEKEIYLVLSATTKRRDLFMIADAYNEVGAYKIIFTKLDETTALGNILNLKLHTGSELSYVTCGQNVPDDIEDFNPQNTVKLLLGGRK